MLCIVMKYVLDLLDNFEIICGTLACIKAVLQQTWCQLNHWIAGKQ